MDIWKDLHLLDPKKRIYLVFSPNKAGLFKRSFSGGRGGSIDPPSYFKKNLTNINITLYNC